MASDGVCSKTGWRVKGGGPGEAPGPRQGL